MTGCKSAEVFVWCFSLHMPLSFEFYLQVAFSDDFFLLRGSEVGTRVADGKGFCRAGVRVADGRAGIADVVTT